MWLRSLLLLALCACMAEIRAIAQQGPDLTQRSDPQQPDTEQPPSSDEASPTVFPHSDRARWYLGGQFNTILQVHPAFPARYSGPNSLRNQGESADSRVFTLYTGYQLTNATELFVDLESAGGRGISDALGLAGYTNLDVVRNPQLGATPYLARLIVRHIIPLSAETVEADRDFLHLATQVPARRLELRAGRFSTVDFFDQNAVGSDSHLQFMNWTVDNNGAFDYAADTRGYTWGALLEYYDRKWAVRFLEALMPEVANGLRLETNLRRAHSENTEFELHPKPAGRNTVIRLLSFVNHADMGDYREAVENFLHGRTAVPDIIATRRPGAIKYGFGLNLQQEVARDVRWFVRSGWNEGRHESFAYTEVDSTIALGADAAGRRWGRRFDRLGAAFVSNGISRDHQQYLVFGGLGFLLGDGALRYGRENIFETYYAAHVWRGVFGSLDIQHINNPGYNRDRGPVWVPGLRLHVDF